MKNSVLPLVTISLLTVLTGCTGLSSVSQETDETELIDIAWLEKQLQAEGIFASPSGPGNWGIPASSSVRLVLDGIESINVYLFEDLELAASEAYEFSNERPQSQVFHKKGLVLVRTERANSGLSNSLRGIMGTAL